MHNRIRLNNTISLFGRGLLLRPCTENQSYWSDKLNTEGTLFLDKSKIDGVPNGNDAEVFSKTLYYNGSTSKSEITFTNDVLLYAKKVHILTSTDNVVFYYTISENDAETGLFLKDTTNRTLTIGSDGTAFFTGYIARVLLEDEQGDVFWDSRSNEGYTAKSWNVVDESNYISEGVWRQFYKDTTKDDVVMTNDLIW